MNINIERVDWQQYHQQISFIRHTVFIEEQGVTKAEEWDGLDNNNATQHFLALLNQNPVATARLLGTGQIGRMCVLKNHRHKTIGSQLFSVIIAFAKQHAYDTLFLHAQVSAIEFYKRFGFTVTGETFYEAGIPHKKMFFDGAS